MLDILSQNPSLFMILLVSLIISLTVHEFAHAFMADKLGDSTARTLGRLTLNPLAHLDLLGSVLLVVGGFGWGKPVPFNPYNLKNPKRDTALIAFAGPLSNFIMALLGAALVRFFALPGFFDIFLYFFVVYNLSLGFFNLIPVNPLDGFKVVLGLLPETLIYQWTQLGQYGIYVLMFLVVTGATSSIVNPLVTISLKLLGFK